MSYVTKIKSIVSAGVDNRDLEHHYLMNPPTQSTLLAVLVKDSLIYSCLRNISAAVQPNVDDPPAEILVPGHHVHSVAQLCHTENTKQDALRSVCRLVQQ